MNGVLTSTNLIEGSIGWLAKAVPKCNLCSEINSGVLCTLMYSTVSNIFGFRVVVDSSETITHKRSVILYVLVVHILNGIPVGRENKADTSLESTKWFYGVVVLGVKSFLTPPLH